jgi:sortase B
MKKLYITLALSVVLLLVTAYLWKFQVSAPNDDGEFNAQSQLYLEVKPEVTTATNTADDIPVDYLSESESVNPDIVAWLTIPDTPIDFPVVQTDDNEYYLTHDLEKNESTYGVPFLDYRCNGDFSDYNSIIYGHNIRGERMFAGLLEFQKAEYFKTHSYGYLTTQERRYTLNFVACLVLKNDSFVYNTVFLTPNEKEVFLQELEENALQYREFSYDSLDDLHLVALSTCSYEFTDARTVLVGYLS